MEKYIIIFITLLITGCSTTKRHYSEENPKNVLHSHWNDSVAEEFISGNYANTYNQLNCIQTPEQATIERNKQLDRFLIGIDTYYYKNKNALITGKAFSNTTSDIIQLGLTGAATFASGGSANVLAGVATALNGVTLSIDKNFFAEQSAMLIASKMDQIRLEKLNQIDKKRVLDCEYSLNSAMKDALDYYYLGTMNGALLAIFNDTGNKMADAQSVELNIIEDKYKAKTKID
ncbi:hypothetical protein [Psychromonas arctica]|uniref:hypothetical protein n=1 Tax=Psychromonas arctica TaxID=168275 RepID=UPI00040E2CBD|nr:hypothetical protein [Psychromonas arctica]